MKQYEITIKLKVELPDITSKESAAVIIEKEMEDLFITPDRKLISIKAKEIYPPIKYTVTKFFSDLSEPKILRFLDETSGELWVFNGSTDCLFKSWLDINDMKSLCVGTSLSGPVCKEVTKEQALELAPNLINYLL